METKAVYMFGRVITDGELLQLRLGEAVKEHIIDSVHYNCTSYIEEKKPEDLAKEQDPVKKSERYAAKGNCTEQGLIRFFMDKIRNNDIILTKQNQRASDKFLRASIPFDSKYKMSFAAINIHSQGVVRIFGKGAPDFLIGHCTTVLNEEGKTDELS